MNCPKCEKESSNTEVCSVCGVIFAKYEASFKTMDIQPKKVDRSQLLMELGFPIIGMIAALLISTFPFGQLLGIWIHECGHAAAGWLGGIATLPTAMGKALQMSERSWFVTLAFTAFLGFIGYKSWQWKTPFLLATTVSLFLAQLYYRFISEDDLQMWFSYMGIGGEFWISAWMMMAFHYKFPEQHRWLQIRFFVFAWGALVFFSSLTSWILIRAGKKDVPYGSLWGGDGDMDMLVYTFGWIPQEITASYLKLGSICILTLIISYIGCAVYKLSNLK
jgi:hypothetical protein